MRKFKPSLPDKGVHDLVEESNDLSSNVLATGFLVVHNTSGGGEDDVTELTRRKKLDNPLLEIAKLDVVAGRNDTGLVEAVLFVSIPFFFSLISSRREMYEPSVELNDNLAGTVVIDLLELANVACIQKG